MFRSGIGFDYYKKIFISSLVLFYLMFYLTGCKKQPVNNSESAEEDKRELQWNWVLKADEYTDIFFADDNLIAVKNDNGKWAFRDLHGEEVVPFEYDSISPFCDGFSLVNREGEMIFINANGEILGNYGFQDARGFSESLAAVKENGLWGYIDKNGKQIIDCKYDEASSFHEGLAVIKIGDEYGVIDKTGYRTFEGKYTAIRDFHEGYAAVQQNGKWGFIDADGRNCIACQYDEVRDFSEGKAAVKVNNYEGLGDQWAYIDSQGNIQIDFYPYEAAEGRRVIAGDFHDGIAFVSKTLYCIIDEEGNDIFSGDSEFFISALTYNKEYDVIPGYVFIDEKMTIKKYGLMGLHGEQRVEPIFDYIDQVCEQYVIVSCLVDGVYRKGIIELNWK